MSATLIGTATAKKPNLQHNYNSKAPRTKSRVIRARAPLRVSFAGGGTDVPPFPQQEGGAVLSATIDRYTYGSLSPRVDGLVHIESVDLGIKLDFRLGDPFELSGDLSLIKAAIRRLCPDDTNGFDLVVHSNVPPGSGLGSSSTIMVTLVALLERHYGLNLSKYEIAELAHEIERVDLGIAGGYQDHYAAAFGGVNFIEFGDIVVVNPLRIATDVLNELELSLLLCYTGTSRQSSKIIDDQSARLACGADTTLAGLRGQRALADQMKSALLRGALSDFGELLDVAWHEKKKLSPLITTTMIDEAYRTAKRAGAIGGKVTGAGGGGFILLFTDFTRRQAVSDAMKALSLNVVDFSFASEGVTTWAK